MKIVFRKADLSDAPRLESITKAAYAKWIGVIGRNPKPMNTAYEDAITEHIVQVIELQRRCVGLLEMHVYPDFLLLENIAILPELQGFRIGLQALNHAEDVAQRMGKSSLRLYTNKAFTSNLNFYANRGFSEIREEMLPDGGLLVHFEKKLSPGGTQPFTLDSARAVQTQYDP